MIDNVIPLRPAASPEELLRSVLRRVDEIENVVVALVYKETDQFTWGCNEQENMDLVWLVYRLDTEVRHRVSGGSEEES